MYSRVSRVNNQSSFDVNRIDPIANHFTQLLETVICANNSFIMFIDPDYYYVWIIIHSHQMLHRFVSTMQALIHEIFLVSDKGDLIYF